MESFSRYVLSVITAALLLGILKGICSSGVHGTLAKLAGGIFLILVMVQPVANFDFSVIRSYTENFSLESANSAETGEEKASALYQSIIKSEVEAYILTKAQALGTNVTAEVALDENSLPVSAVLQGDVSPYAKSRLVAIMEEDLGIAKEYQTWIG